MFIKILYAVKNYVVNVYNLQILIKMQVRQEIFPLNKNNPSADDCVLRTSVLIQGNFLLIEAQQTASKRQAELPRRKI